jgi:hypothetical protein
MIDRKTVAVVVVALACGYCVANWQTSQANDRPVLRFIAKAAKAFLWVALVAEQPPEGPQPDHRLAHSAIGEDGYPIIDNARGW